MNPTGLPLLLALAGATLAGLIVLPGLILKLVAGFARLSGRRVVSPTILGPLFWYELVSVTRRGSHHRLRAIYSSGLLMGLFVALMDEFRGVNPIRLLLGTAGEFPLDRMTTFAERFFQLFLFFQLLALTLVAPVFAGGSIIEEKERGTLELLQTSLMTNRELVLGKLLARIAFVLGLALTGLPVLAITMLFGGVDPTLLIVSFVSAILSTVSLAAFSFWQATRVDSLKTVLIVAYSLVLVLFVLGSCFLTCANGWVNLYAISPFALLIQNTGIVGVNSMAAVDPVEAAIPMIAVHGLMTVLFTALSIARIRTVIGRGIPSRPEGEPVNDATRPRWVEVEWNADGDASSKGPAGYRRERPPPRFVRVPPVDESNPILWKETYFGGRLHSLEMDTIRGCSLAFFVASLVPVLFGVFAAAASADRPQDVLNPFFRIASVGFAVTILPFAGLRAVGCVSSERQRRSLDSLFSLPIERSDILGDKARAAVQWLLHWLIGFGVLALVILFTGSVRLPVLIATLLIVAAASLFFLSLAIWLSVRYATVFRGSIWYIAIVLFAFVSPPLLGIVVQSVWDLLGHPETMLDSLTSTLSVPYALYEVQHPASGRSDPSLSDTRIGSVIGSIILIGVLILVSGVLWRSAVRRFETEGK